MKTEGVLTGCDQSHEWMLKDWWYYYSQTNTYPVIFCDFGMSQSARLWCEKRGTVMPVSNPPGIPVTKEKIDPKLWKEWEKLYSDSIWTGREFWFRKSIAMDMSPFDSSMWIDLDTFVIKPLTPFMEASHEHGIAMVRWCGGAFFNAGIISYEADVPFLQTWIETIRTSTHLFNGDQEILNHIIDTQNVPVTELPTIFNRKFEHLSLIHI